ncbi:MAG: hypothetical protein ACHQK8_07420, partial [Bacteroidia bacterium]
MKRRKLFYILYFISVSGCFQTFAQAWKPSRADTTFPRSIINASEVAGVKAALLGGTNISLYTSLY